jgi:4-amino-4-deoxy-L-arabinose transferase-like glycosyltransferase
VAVVAAIGCVPIIGQPVQVDDPLFLGVARQILATPTNPFGGPPPWHDGDWFSQNANPPLWSYLLAATAVVFGWNETAFHALQCLANIALAFGIFALARRACTRPLFWTSACLLSPFLLPGRNLMADTLLLALWCWSFELFLQDALDEKRGRSVWAGWLAAAALLTKYTGGLLAPIFFLLCLRWRTHRHWSWLLPIFVFGLWCGHNQYYYGRTHFFANVGGGGISLLDRSRVFTRIVGGMMVWGPVWLLAAWVVGGVWRKLLILLAVPAALALAWIDFHDVEIRLKQGNVIAEADLVLHFAAFTAMGVLQIASLFASPSGDADRKTRFALGLWLTIATAFNLLATSAVAFGAVRHLLIVFVPAILLGGGAFDRASSGRILPRALAWLTLLVSVALGGLLAHGDRLAARAGVEATEEATRLMAQGRQVLVAGDPALCYMAERVGARFWRGEMDRVPVNGIVATCYFRSLAFKRHPMLVQQSALLQKISLESWNRFRTQTTYASFYAANVLSLPWMAETSRYSRGPDGGWEYDLILVYRRVR